MIQVIDQLGRDHRNMRLLLDIVEAEMAGYRAGQSPDFELLQMIARYMLDYPDLIHHPNTEKILASFLADVRSLGIQNISEGQAVDAWEKDYRAKWTPKK